jgi:hypothetical protein
MPMVCPQCNRSFEQQLQCPSCDARLLYHAQLRPGAEGASSTEGQWQHTPWGRILVGVVLAQGLALGLQLFFKAGLQVSGEEAEKGDWDNPAHVILVQSLHAFSLLLGGILTGAGQRRGIFFGSVVGLVHGLVTLGIQQVHGEVLSQVGLCAVPALHMAFGAVGGLVGSLIWRPLPTIHLATRSEPDKKARKAFTTGGGISFLAGKVAWIRVGLGIGLVVSGVLGSSAILKFVLDNAPVRLSVENSTQFEMITWEIAALTTFLGAAIAGATTTNGLKQGLFVGLGAGMILTGMTLAKPNPDLDRSVITAVSALLLSVGGGWFGGQLFPRIYQRPRRRHSHLLSEAG